MKYLSKNIQDLSGKRFGKLVVIRHIDSKIKKGKWICLCDCGKEKEYIGSVLIKGRIKSCGCLFRPSNTDACISRKLSIYKFNAKKRKIEFKLTKKEFSDLIFGKCHYCGNPPSILFKRNEEDEESFSNGVDRLDNNLGYLKNNCVSCCDICNYAKRDLSEDFFKEWIKKVYLHTFSKECNNSIGLLIDSLVTTNIKCFMAQEDIKNYSSGGSECIYDNSEKIAEASLKAQSLNAKRNELMRAINESLGFSQNNLTEKTY